MGAGSGFKTFASGDILTASDVNGYLMQGVWVFANAAARTAAVTSPQEGNASFLKDTNSLEIYDGAAWVAYGSGDITGVTTGANSGLTGGATSGTADIKLNMAAKGDLIAGTGSGTSTVVTVGANNTVLTADSTATGGVKWASVATGSNWSLLNAGGTALTGATTVTVSGISSKDKIMVIIDEASSVNASAVIGVRVNTLSTSIYYRWGSYFFPASTYSATNLGYLNGAGAFIYIGGMGDNAASRVAGGVTITGAASSGVKQFIANGSAGNAGNSRVAVNLQGYVDESNAITSISVFSDSGNLDNGTVYVYTSA